MQWSVAAMAGLVGVWYLALPFWLSGPLNDYVRQTMSAQGPSGPGYTSSLFGPLITVVLAITSIGVAAVAAAVVIGALRRWTWMHYGVMVLFGFAILELPAAFANATGIIAVAPFSGPLVAVQWASVALGVTAIGFFAWMMVASLRRGPWATRKVLTG